MKKEIVDKFEQVCKEIDGDYSEEEFQGDMMHSCRTEGGSIDMIGDETINVFGFGHKHGVITNVRRVKDVDIEQKGDSMEVRVPKEEMKSDNVRFTLKRGLWYHPAPD